MVSTIRDRPWSRFPVYPTDEPSFHDALPQFLQFPFLHFRIHGLASRLPAG